MTAALGRIVRQHLRSKTALYKRMDPNSEGLPQLLYVAALLSLAVSNNLQARESTFAAEGFRAERASHELHQVCKALLRPDQMTLPRELYGRVLPILQSTLQAPQSPGTESRNFSY